ncbi:MAG TPA: methyltransferase domain-containing protein [Burkholderiales bacterium]|nr:methyltransferase domain-containing protein [Burkholderiales bacterium]
MHQNPRPSAAALADFYASDKYHPPEVHQDAEKYARFSDWYFREKVEHAIAQSGRETGRVLEIGCGLGGGLLQFYKKGWEVFGVEPDSRQAEFASRELKLPNVSHGLADDRFHLKSKVDLVYTNHAFEHFSDLHSIMRFIVRVLNPGGRIFTAIPTYYENRSNLSKLWMNSAHYSLFTHRSLNQLFSRYGIVEISHTYRGWTKEIDDLWHMAEFRGGNEDASEFYEDANSVRRYVNVYNPIRSVLYAPLYAGYSKRVALREIISRNLKQFVGSPGSFLRALPGRLRSRLAK